MPLSQIILAQHEWYRARLRVTQVLTSSPASSVLLALCLLHQLGGVVCLLFFVFFVGTLYLHFTSHDLSQVLCISHGCYYVDKVTQNLKHVLTVLGWCKVCPWHVLPGAFLLAPRCSRKGIYASRKNMLLGRAFQEYNFQTFFLLGL